MEITPSICEHVTETAPYAGLMIDNAAHWLCPACLVDHCIKLLDSMKMTPSQVANLVHVEPENLEAITLALHQARVSLRTINSHLSNQVNQTKQKIYKATHTTPKFRVNENDGGPPSYKRTVIVPRVVEPKSLSSYNGVEVWNRMVTA
jgi:hypothetical protein